MNRFVKAASGGERAVSCLEVDAAISNPADMTLEQVDHLAQLEPYGSGNPRPVFALLGVLVPLAVYRSVSKATIVERLREVD